MATHSLGQSKSKGKKDDRKSISISYQLKNQKWDFSKQQGRSQAKIPSDIPLQYGIVEDLDSELIFDFKNADASGHHCIQIMTECFHENILHAPVVEHKNEEGPYSIWHEPYTGNLKSYLESTSLGTNMMHGSKVMLPTPMLQSIISKIFDGMELLRLRGKYHGNFSLENTYYLIKERKIVVKLANFKKKETKSSTRVYQAEDFQAIGVALQEISKFAKEHKYYRFDCSQIDDLAEDLREFAFGQLDSIKEKIRRHPFFWDYDKRKFLLISEVPLAMISASFRSKIQECKDLCIVPWGKDDYDGLIELMDGYRVDKSMPKFDKKSRVDYVLCISGMYTHEKELKAQVKVDRVIMERNPGLFLLLNSLLPSS